MKKNLTMDGLVAILKQAVKENTGVELEDQKFKGVAYNAFREAGLLNGDDKYKNYEHVARLTRLFQENFGEDITWEDVEHFAGNPLFAMRLLTKRALEKIDDLIGTYNKKYKDKPGATELLQDVNTDLLVIKDSVRLNIRDAWTYLENTQLAGANMIINKILKAILAYKNGLERPKKRKSI